MGYESARSLYLGKVQDEPDVGQQIWCKSVPFDYSFKNVPNDYP